ncbi:MULTISPECIES: arsenate reductase (glutaredoxin) [unclassified Polaribacter]|jgi:arsenate reductase|uniref:arsenate reductase (glutaredoxin) n=1 Tax=unclassified Polaribacter TaxID=196858 RepID=UPI00052BA787|nr:MULTISPECIES: arsenate reductase (glutaredoxin) [unclassified Polaribacter]KGL60739.1 arsenate reductase [Polaribacter sp. Hel1_33_49]MBT3742737.1 arsenate reductase (glutaredoxin) [Polaribacter sp.]MDG1195395.1 arsenate reductase (glutaredoxin) [Polaribacter sp.]PKV64969.1 arsenate reductase [Polaribacter sp. Hel1_33_96]
MIKIYHNPRCSKSRQGLAILEDSKKEFEVIKYLDHTLSEEELNELIKFLNISPIDLVRKNEKIWKENYKGKELSDKEIIIAMVENPKLIERPIVINNNKAVIGRPPEKIAAIL